ncbi:hypothetical protein BGZ99_007096 [Dissophora globulifera]|uniref:Uncharacterized protein n=1 Tax=Dissophora globulifera TaxID=979702 RepID=A0A9P6RUY8_9FUNG|nr:hypothetical protein BGZ99_007096 [Dissophora globulifera]
MLHQFDTSAIAQHQQQQQPDNDSNNTSSNYEQRIYLDQSHKTQHSGSQGPGFVQERYGGSCNAGHLHPTNYPLPEPSSPLMLSPTILPSQAQELHPHQHLHHPHPQPHHQRSGFQLQLQQQLQQQHELRLQELEELTRREPSVVVEAGFHRKRSLSVPLLFTLGQNQQGHGVDSLEVQSSTRAKGNGDQDMEMDDADDESSATKDAVSSNSSSSSRIGGVDQYSNGVVVNYGDLKLPRESFLATLPRSHRHRIYAGAGIHSMNQHSHHNHHPHHYTLRHHIHYNPFTYRKFPPYKYWAASAQRDYHLATIGVVGIGRANSTDVERGLTVTESRAGSGPPPGAGGDLVLRGSVSNGGVNKSVYRSRLPVHLRHMTSRINRRAAICVNPFQGVDTSLEKRYQGHQEGTHGRQQEEQHQDDLAGPLLSSLGMEDLSISGVSSMSTPLPAIPGSTADLALPSTSSSGSSGMRRGLSDWKRATAHSHGMGEVEQRSGMVMRIASNDLVTPQSSTFSPSSGGRGSERHWRSQRGGLANLLQAKQSSATRPGSSGVAGGSGSSTVDRLVEEMNKWSV